MGTIFLVRSDHIQHHCAGHVASAAALDGLQVPDTLQVDGRALHLNGYGLRTYSILAIHIYVASLYLEN